MPTQRIAVIDLETTGLSPWHHDRVVEVAIVVISPDGAVQAEYETLVNPGRDIGSSSLHRISAGDVLRAPTFPDIAGDVLRILADTEVVAGHNVGFDRNFLLKEYERIGVSIPDIPLLCTCRLLRGNNLQVCCDELGICFEGTPHWAISDARTTAHVVSYLCTDDPTLLDAHRITRVSWPSLPALHTPCFCRRHAQEARNEPPRFLQRIAAKIRHDVEAEAPNILEYLALIDRVVEDRMIDENEENTLVEAASNWQLSRSQLAAAHREYIHNLAVAALADGVVTDSERRDLLLVARLLGQDDATLNSVLESAAAQLASAPGTPASVQTENSLRGLRVCFTGELQSTIGGEPISRDVAEALATKAGLIVASSVTKKLDLLVVADPNTQSGKAKKARSYGIRILSDAVFWSLAGIPVD